MKPPVTWLAWLRLPLLLLCLDPQAVWAGDLGATLHPVAGRPAAPDFKLPDIDGATHRLSDYRGKVVIVSFWATWCPPCREEMPSMQRAWKRLKQENTVILAVNVGEDEDTIFTFTADYPMDFPLLMDLDSSVVQRWPVRGLPTTFVVDPQGRIVYRAVGSRDWEDPLILKTLRSLQTVPAIVPK
ncbi:MAG: TlpA disulfide reductase family protein [Gammaproteobacteria bacterium]|jgi:peroxiredoxin